jgi:hypothetical protein
MPVALAEPAKPEVAWVAAFVLGLAYSAKSDAESVDELIHACHGHDELMVEARSCLADLDIVDAHVHARAERLLDAALATVTGGTAPLAV